MASFQFDQAEGLRRMLGAAGGARIVSFFATAPALEKGGILLNLGAMLARAGSNVLLLDACGQRRSFRSGQRLGMSGSLAQVARGACTLEQVLHEFGPGIQLATLGQGPGTAPAALEALFREAARQADVALVDAETGAEQALPLKLMADGEFMIQVSPDPSAIMAGYAIIKRLHVQLGRRPFGVLVTGADEAAALPVFRNMAQAASRYLGLELHFLGWVPPDEHLARAARLGRPVVEAFPLAGASVAFRHLAGHFMRDPALQEA